MREERQEMREREGCIVLGRTEVERSRDYRATTERTTERPQRELQ